MFIPRLRRINDVIKEMQSCDNDTAITYYFLHTLFKNENIKTIKYGNAWLVNLDELYAFFATNGGLNNETTNENTKTDNETVF